MSLHHNAIICRFNVSPEQVTTFFFKQFVAFLFAAFWFANLITLMRFLQVVVWKRVKEINENIIDRATSVSVILITQALGLLCNPEYKLLVAVSTFSKQPASAPFPACHNDIDPFHQKISIRAHVVAGNVNFICIHLLLYRFHFNIYLRGYSVFRNISKTGMLMHTFAIVSIRLCGKLTVPPKLIHDEDNVNPRNARYNKALTTLKSLPVFLVFYAVCLAHIVVASKAQGIGKHKEESLLNLNSLNVMFLQLIKQSNNYLSGPLLVHPCSWLQQSL